MKKLVILSGIVFILVSCQNAQNNNTITFKANDDVEITADLYLTDNLSAPFIILFHQAGYSRGEYLEIAPKLNKLGFNCMAVDQRSGSSVNNIKNETAKFAKELNKGSKYEDAFPDLQAALNMVKKRYNPEKLIIWGSSYSASLVFILAAKNKDIDGLLSFSPGEYFEFEEKSIKEWAKEVECPVFVTSSKNEGSDCKIIFDQAHNSNNLQYIPANNGYHGSKALWDSNKGFEDYWKEVETFLEKITQ